MSTEDRTPNAGHYHEATDRAHTINVMIDELLAEHPAIEAHPQTLGRAVRKLQDAAMELYQVAGVLMAAAGDNEESDHE